MRCEAGRENGGPGKAEPSISGGMGKGEEVMLGLQGPWAVLEHFFIQRHRLGMERALAYIPTFLLHTWRSQRPRE